MSIERLAAMRTRTASPVETAQPPPAANKRRSNRKSGKTPGLIYPGGVAASIPCTIADQSGLGARLLMQPGWVNPFRGLSSLGEKFTLVMRLDRMEVDCEIVRIAENEMGVKYTSLLRPVARKM